MPLRTYTSSEIIVDNDDNAATVSIPAGGALTTVLSFRCKPGVRPRIESMRTSVDAAGVNSIAFALYVNEVQFYPYNSGQIQFAAPEADAYFPVDKEIPQLSQVAVKATNSSGSTAYNLTARLIIAYFDIVRPQPAAA